MKIYDWQLSLWKQLAPDLAALPHALLLTGPSGLGKLAFARALAARLLCEQGNVTDDQAAACGRCSSCTWLASGNHPDFRLVRPDDGEEGEAGTTAEVSTETEKASTSSVTLARKSSKATIGIAQIRALADFVFIGSHRHGKRVIVIEPAEAMTPAAANSLLKILEEPPAGVYFLMVSHAWRRLLPTIRSRCRVLPFGRPDPVVATQWLAENGVQSAQALLSLVGGTPLLAAEWAQQGGLARYEKALNVLLNQPVDPIAMAAQWATLLKGEDSFDLPQLVEVLQKWVYDLILWQLSQQVRYHTAWREKLQAQAQKASSTALLSCYTELLQIRAVARHPLNAQLFLEDLAARYLRVLSVARA